MKLIRVLGLVLIAIIFMQCNAPLVDKQAQLVSLCDARWEFAEQDSLKYHSATVPGSVHMDLLDNGLISEPYYRDNEEQLQWIGERNWNYRCSFEATKELLKEENISLCFDGLDTYAEVFLNAQKVLTANNYFREWNANVKGILKPGLNNLEVRFKSPVSENKSLKEKDSIPLFDDYVYTRKPAFHFGWDWGPVFITSGIWRPVYIKAWSDAIINDCHFVQKELIESKAVYVAHVEIESNKNSNAQVILKVENTDIDQKVEVELTPGINFIAIPFEINEPKLWWSRGLGDAHLYSIKTKLISNGVLQASKESIIGVRTLKLVQNPDSNGASFHFELNGVPVFAKGANYIPQESFQSKVDSSDYQRVIKHALDANMNMLRVWGGGFYEEDYFYDLCDQNGILVWQDFMFACSMYPGENDYLENVKQEAVENVKRLRNHPSLALWCGNNENFIGWKDWRWSNKFSKQDSATVWHDYERLFHEILPEVIEKYDGDKAYWPSSPKYGWGYPVNKDGDVHLWAVWHAQDPFEVFLEEENIGRFMSEYGFQSLPEMKTINAFTLPEDRQIDSDVMKAHQKHRVGYPVIDKYIKRDYNWPKDFESYVYVSQVLQAKGIKMAIEAHRRAMPFCMGTLYWQINDCWPVASWSSVDYYNRWKALHYKVRDAYADLLVSSVVKDNQVEIHVISDLLKNKEGQLHLRLLDFKGNLIWEDNREVIMEANTSKLVASYSCDSILQGQKTNELVLVLELLENGAVLSTNHNYFERPKDLNLKDPKISYTIKEISSDTIQIALRAETLAKDVCLSFPDMEGFFTDNYFDLVPGKEKKVVFVGEGLSDIEDRELLIKSLQDSF